MQFRMVAAAGGAIGALALAGCGGSSSGGGNNGGGGTGPIQHPNELVGSVGEHDAFIISLSDESGNAITHLASGTYKLTVHDLSSIHDFHLTGGGVNDSTSVSDKTTKTFSATFKPGTYTFVCDPHSSQMHGSFTVS